MIDVMENIKKLSAALDAETASLHPSGKLLLLGSQDSVFLKAIKRKADQLGINCDHTSNPLPPYRGIVVDSETVSFNSILDPDVDIDHSYSPGMSAVSQAVMDLLIESGLVWEKDITIVGRGHAVKELAKYLRAKLLGDFSMRGQESVESATKSSAAFCLSFLNTATVPAILWLEHNYACRVENDAVAYGALSTEHSVMCSNYAVDGDEITHVRRLLKEIYPYQNFSMVSDSYDYWNLVNNILPAIKEDVMEHHGCLAIRGDSGNPVEIVTETVFKLWEIFGGTVNSKGYKVLDPHVKALYGDSITPQRCEAVYKILMEHGFAINNVSLGVGSFSMQCLETMDGGEKTYAPYTRDTFGIAVKATYAEDADGKPIMIFKNPKTDSGHFKKSQRGCCKVVYDYTYHNFFCQDGLTWEESQVGNWLQPVFKDGKPLRIYTLDEVRKNLHEGNF